LKPRDSSLANLALLAGLALIAFVVMGYHPGLEDDAFYLAAIKHDLNPALFPHDSEFFRLQFQATIFDKLIAFSDRLTHLPLAWAVLLWQFATIFLLLHGCWRISRRCFANSEAQWTATALVAVLLTLPVPGISLNLADQHLHPRTLATAAILAAIVAVMDRRLWFGGFLLAVAFSIHAIMACFGISFCAFLLWNSRKLQTRDWMPAPALLLPLDWLFQPTTDAWRQAAATRGFYFLGHWEWYEWLGVIAPPLILLALQRLGILRRTATENSPLQVLIKALLQYFAFQTAVGVVLMLTPGLERVRPLEPMRYLHLFYLLFFLLVGGLIGQYLLRRHFIRWAMLFVPLAAGMCYAQHQMYPASIHIELPFLAPRNPWLEAFAWIRENTPVDSLFAIDPHYMTLPGEDYHGFRALAERSVLADYEKDGGMAARVPPLAPRWLKEVTAQTGWRTFQMSDFLRLKQDFGVNWIVLSRADAMFSAAGRNAMTCPYENQQLRICRLY
jgi:hypothetical protein